MDSKEPLISVFIPYYNDNKYLSACIQSVLNQTYKNFELFLFNHASTDGSRDIARSYNDSRIKHIDSAVNLGAGSGLNLINSLPLMAGKYVKLFTSDDEMEADCLEKMLACLENNPDKDIVVCDTSFINENGKKISDKTWFILKKQNGLSFESDELNILEMFLYGLSPLPYPSIFLKKEHLLNIELDKTFVLKFDTHLLTSLIVQGKKIAVIKDCLIKYRVHKEQQSIDLLRLLYGVGNDRENTHGKTAYFEQLAETKIFFEIKDIEIAKRIAPGEYSQKLQKGDECFIPFVISQFLLSKTERDIAGYLKMHELMQDDSMREKISRKFNYDIKDFRRDYSNEIRVNNRKTSLIILEERERGWYLNISNKIKIKLFPKSKKNA